MSKLYQALIERANRKDLLDWAEGANGLLAVTKERVYIIRAQTWSKPEIKTYEMRSISSIQVREPGRLSAGHIQIIASGVGDRTGTFSSAFNYALDENTVMIKDNYDHFLRLEQLIYNQKASSYVTPVVMSISNEDDVFVKLEKLKALLDASIISQTEYEAKRVELLSRI